MEQPEEASDITVLELLRLVDSKYKKRLRYNLRNPFFILLILLIIILVAGEGYIEVYFGIVKDVATDLEIVIPLFAIFIAFFAVFEKETDNASVIGNYKVLRKDKIVNKNNEHLLKSLIIMKTKQAEVNLEQIYRLNGDLFTLEKLLEQLYK
jgi:hypothetical protein